MWRPIADTESLHSSEFLYIVVGSFVPNTNTLYSYFNKLHSFLLVKSFRYPKNGYPFFDFLIKIFIIYFIYL